jgi:diguanylate cyclase (GGDEF)-like protein
MNSSANPSIFRSVPVVTAGTATAAVVLAILTTGTALEGTLWVLPLAPAALATWYIGWRWGIFVVAVAAAVPVVEVAVLGIEVAGPPGGTLALLLRAALMGAFVVLLALAQSAPVGERLTVRVDGSTGLAHSRVLFDQIGVELERCQRYSRAFTIAYVTIENVAVLRQRHGDTAAEEALRRIAHQIKGSLRSVDLVARLRDREFGVLFPETGPAPARLVLERMERLLAVSLHQEAHPLSYAIGALTWVRSDLGPEALHQRTYQLMYTARQEARTINHEVLDEEHLGEVSNKYLTVRGGLRSEPPAD